MVGCIAICKLFSTVISHFLCVQILKLKQELEEKDAWKGSG